MQRLIALIVFCFLCFSQYGQAQDEYFQELMSELESLVNKTRSLCHDAKLKVSDLSKKVSEDRKTTSAHSQKIDSAEAEWKHLSQIDGDAELEKIDAQVLKLKELKNSLDEQAMALCNLNKVKSATEERTKKYNALLLLRSQGQMLGEASSKKLGEWDQWTEKGRSLSERLDLIESDLQAIKARVSDYESQNREFKSSYKKIKEYEQEVLRTRSEAIIYVSEHNGNDDKKDLAQVNRWLFQSKECVRELEEEQELLDFEFMELKEVLAPAQIIAESVSYDLKQWAEDMHASEQRRARYWKALEENLKGIQSSAQKEKSAGSQAI